ncbi:MAG TPA: carboxymuconolactone decarboxylase family protein [Candidatus Angelobacter sp.]|nr:carboxymuconolactone decarboxylase family protein [Candidatus Angelobacter sp.]
MTTRLNAKAIAPDAYNALRGLQNYVDGCGIEKPLLELIKVRASQINGCAFCIAMHTADAAKGGESQARLHLLNAWRETELFTARERATLALTEAVTLVAESHVPDEVYDAARQQFSDKEVVDLAYAIFAINTWNRLAITFRMQPLVATEAKAA